MKHKLEIEHKYEIGQTLFFLKGECIFSLKVTGIFFTNINLRSKDDDPDVQVFYNGRVENGHLEVEEEKLFPDAGSLAAHLLTHINGGRKNDVN